MVLYTLLATGAAEAEDFVKVAADVTPLKGISP
jgi:hypothetical protein